MGIYPSSASDDVKMRAWYVGRLEFRSNAYGRYGLDDDIGRLVGIAPEALSAPDKAIVRPSLEQSLAVVNKQLGNSEI